eukprot:TRINITY_DN20953_c0_g1_i1.p1 TRINITY_DN20953_c0_g1~~TRINITY_DN20953_c0_g1_i1.p1  ORF type:complete len:316 (-),score=30.38 TRINITY_DN20953_c0_g1_i1:505-1452(-)
MMCSVAGRCRSSAQTDLSRMLSKRSLVCNGQLRVSIASVGREVVRRPPTLWERAKSLPRRRPFAFSVGLNSTLFTIADVNAQLLDDRGFDPLRLVAFCSFGLFQGAASFYTYFKVFERVCPGTIRFANLSWRQKVADRAGQIDVLKQVALDNLVYTPFWFFPWFYTFKTSIRGSSSDSVEARALAGLEQYKVNCVDDNIASCAFWVPADVLVFAVPAWLRMPVSGGLNFGFTFLLSRIRGADQTELVEHDERQSKFAENLMIRLNGGISKIQSHLSDVTPVVSSHLRELVLAMHSRLSCELNFDEQSTPFCSCTF